MESNPLWCQVLITRENSRAWARGRELPKVLNHILLYIIYIIYFLKQGKRPFCVSSGCVCVCHRCQDLRPPEEEPGRGAAEAHDALGGAAVHPGQQRLPAVAQPPGRHVSPALRTCPILGMLTASLDGGLEQFLQWKVSLLKGRDEFRGPFQPKTSLGFCGLVCIKLSSVVWFASNSFSCLIATNPFQIYQSRSSLHNSGGQRSG